MLLRIVILSLILIVPVRTLDANAQCGSSSGCDVPTLVQILPNVCLWPIEFESTGGLVGVTPHAFESLSVNAFQLWLDAIVECNFENYGKVLRTEPFTTGTKRVTVVVVGLNSTWDDLIWNAPEPYSSAAFMVPQTGLLTGQTDLYLVSATINLPGDPEWINVSSPQTLAWDSDWYPVYDDDDGVLSVHLASLMIFPQFRGHPETVGLTYQEVFNGKETKSVQPGVQG